MDLKERAVDIALDALDDLTSAARLEFVMSTGAVVLLLHLLLEADVAKWLLVLIALSALCFSVSSVQCIYGLVEASMIKIGLVRALTADVERRGDLFLIDSSDAIEGFKRRMGSMDRMVVAGIVFAAAFTIGFVMTRLKAH